MAMPRDSFQTNIEDSIKEGWRVFINKMEDSIDILEKEINEATEMSHVCSPEWCEATEHVIDEISNSLFSISEPRWSLDEDSKKIKALKRKVHDLYAEYKSAAR